MSERTLLDLTGRDVGSVVTLQGSDWQVTGVLYSLNHDREWIEEQALMDAEPRRTPGAPYTDVTVGPWSCTFRNPSSVSVVTEGREAALISVATTLGVQTAWSFDQAIALVRAINEGMD